MLGSSSGLLETRTDNSTFEQHQTEEYFRSNNEVKNSVSTGHYGDQSKNPGDENFQMSQKTSIPRDVDLGSTTMEPEQEIGELVSDPWLVQNPKRFVGALTESEKVHFLTGSSYEGTWDALGMAGVGRYELPNGAIYEGEIRDGMFHGHGSFYWSKNQRLDVVHFRGELKEYRYEFQDGLDYKDTNWKYCEFPDRRFSESMKKGLRPGGRTRKTAEKSAKVLPSGCYDTGDGIFDPTNQRITSYDDPKKILRIASAEERAWILKKCRKSWSEPTGYRPELNENWSKDPPSLPYNLPMSEDSPDHWWKRLTTFTKDANRPGGNFGGSENSSVDRQTILFPTNMCMCCGTVLIGEPCRCINFYPSSHEQEEYDEVHRRPSEQMRENEYENCESSSTFSDSEDNFNRTETHEYAGSKINRSSDGLIRREKVSKETVPEASQDDVLEMKLLPENVTHGNETEIKSTERKSDRDFSVDSEIENAHETARQLEEKSDKMISESSGIRQESIQTFKSNNNESKEGFERDDDAKNKSQSDEQLLSGTTVGKLNPSNPLETVQFIEESQTDFIQDTQSIVETEEKVEIHESKSEKLDSNIEKVKSIKKSHSGVISDNKSTSDAEQTLKDSISLISKTNEGPEVSGLIDGPKSSATLNLKTTEKSESAGFSSTLEKPKTSIIIERGQTTSLDRVHPSLASLKSTKAPSSKDKKLIEIYNKTSLKTEATNEPTNSNVWRLSSANENYGPETKIKNLLFHPALTAPRSENVVYVRRPCDHRACTTSIRETRATASRTSKEYSSDIPTKSMSADCNCKTRTFQR